MIILIVGFIDDTRSLGPRIKLLGQALAVLALYLGGIRIQIDRRPEPEPRPGISQPARSTSWAFPSTWRFPACSSRCSGSWAA